MHKQHILHILHILHIINQYCTCSQWKRHSLHCLLQLLLCPPSQGPAVYKPPPTTITTVLWFVAESSGKVSWFPTHGKRYCSCRSNWNKRKESQYGGHWNHIQDLFCLTALVDYCRLTLIQPGWGWYIINMYNMQIMQNVTWLCKYAKYDQYMLSMQNMYWISHALGRSAV